MLYLASVSAKRKTGYDEGQGAYAEEARLALALVLSRLNLPSRRTSLIEEMGFLPEIVPCSSSVT